MDIETLIGIRWLALRMQEEGVSDPSDLSKPIANRRSQSRGAESERKEREDIEAAILRALERGPMTMKEIVEAERLCSRLTFGRLKKLTELGYVVKVKKSCINLYALPSYVQKLRAIPSSEERKKQILDAIGCGPATANEISKVLGITTRAVANHLTDMVKSGQIYRVMREKAFAYFPIVDGQSR